MPDTAMPFSCTLTGCGDRFATLDEARRHKHHELTPMGRLEAALDQEEGLETCIAMRCDLRALLDGVLEMEAAVRLGPVERIDRAAAKLRDLGGGK